MDIVSALLLLIVMYVVIPVAACAITIALLGGGDRFLPGAMRERSEARREGAADHH